MSIIIKVFMVISVFMFAITVIQLVYLKTKILGYSLLKLLKRKNNV